MRALRQASLQAVTLETVATTAKAAGQAVQAYRVGGHRLIETIDARITAPAARGAERVAPRLADALRRSGSQAGVLAAQGIDALSHRGDAVIGAASNGAAAQVKRIAGMAKGVSNPLLVQGLDTAARLSLPAAQAVLALSERVADLTARLPQGGRAKPVAKAAKPRAAAPRRRTTAKATSAGKASVQRGAKAAPQAAAPAAVRQAAARPAKAGAPAGTKSPVKAAGKAGALARPAKAAKAVRATPTRAASKAQAVTPAATPSSSTAQPA